MTAEELSASLKDIEAVFDRKLASLQKNAQVLAEKYPQHIAEAIRVAGFVVCPECGGHGKKERLDSGIMRKFGLRQWDGCETCGGDGREFPGRGFIEEAKK